MPVIITGGVLKKNIVHDQGFEGLSRKPRRAAAAAPLHASALQGRRELQHRAWPLHSAGRAQPECGDDARAADTTAQSSCAA